ncbi:MAG: hypothetical protein ACI8W1_003239 [Candidatus Azotimanducaceae bacterium]|jgi:hypothetical protein
MGIRCRMTIRIKAIEGYPDNELVKKICTTLSDQPPYPIDLFEKKLKHQNRIFGCYAYEDKNLVGYKIGTNPDQDTLRAGKVLLIQIIGGKASPKS